MSMKTPQKARRKTVEGANLGHRAQSGRKSRIAMFTVLAGGSLVVLTGCGASTSGNGTNSANNAASATGSTLQVVAAEPQYGNIVQEIGGSQVTVYTVINNPNTDPHDYQAGTNDAKQVAAANLVVQNGLGYDSFMNQLESSSPNQNRKVVEAGQVLGGTAGVTNPHIWYQPGAMAKVAQSIETDLVALRPSQKALFSANLAKFTQSLQPWQQEIQQVKQKFSGSPVAVTEPVADDMLEAAGLSIKTPSAFETAVMNGTDASPQSVAQEQGLLTHHEVKMLVYNEQATDSVTTSLLSLAKTNHIPVVPVYETMPRGTTYAQWMLSETKEIYGILNNGK